MDFICLSVAIVSFLYLVIILFFTTGWLLKHNYINSSTEKTTFISVAIAARNEEKQILFLLKALKDQTYKHFEIIFVDDHSTDKTATIISDFLFAEKRLISLPEKLHGKKSAIALAISQAKGNLIVTTDADCIPEPKWLETIADFYEKEKPDFIIGPVKHSGKLSFLQKLFSLDFLSLQASGAGASEMKKPFICNGANIAFKKSLWNDVSLSLNQPFASGDDVFLLHTIIKKVPSVNIRFLFSKDVIVKTPAPDSLSAFFNQRIRWASKAKGYKNTMAVITSIVVLFINISLYGLFVGLFFYLPILYCFLALFTLKLLVDFPLLYFSAAFFNERKLLIYYLPLQIIYFTYTSILAFCSLFGNYNWKDRKVK
jgi:cellulose synthase/poly-beta-1,6-N-acetylglucosamine synthase-like glycosyltransferase